MAPLIQTHHDLLFVCRLAADLEQRDPYGIRPPHPDQALIEAATVEAIDTLSALEPTPAILLEPHASMWDILYAALAVSSP